MSEPKDFQIPSINPNQIPNLTHVLPQYQINPSTSAFGFRKTGDDFIQGKGQTPIVDKIFEWNQIIKKQPKSCGWKLEFNSTTNFQRSKYIIGVIRGGVGGGEGGPPFQNSPQRRYHVASYFITFFLFNFSYLGIFFSHVSYKFLSITLMRSKIAVLRTCHLLSRSLLAVSIYCTGEGQSHIWPPWSASKASVLRTCLWKSREMCPSNCY